jgi:hypothetical protein
MALCHCQEIHRHYGPRPFKCNFVSCEYQRIGFETKHDRRGHLRTHDRPWTCDVAGCEYSKDGFISRQMRDRHLDSAHRVTKSLESISNNTVGQHETVALLKVLIKKNKIGKSNSAKEMFDSLSYDGQDIVLLEAASCGTYEAVDLLWSDRAPAYRDDYEHTFFRRSFRLLPSALEGLNHEFLKWFRAKAQERLEKHQGGDKELWRFNRGSWDLNATWRALLQCSEPTAVYQQYLKETIFSIVKFDYDGHQAQAGPIPLAIDFIRPTQGNHIMESLLISVWTKLDENLEIKKEYWAKGLCHVAETTCSITLADWLHGRGAELDYDRKVYPVPPLLLAAQNDTLEAARFMRWLLYRGADPQCREGHGGSKMGDVSLLIGPREIHKMVWQVMGGTGRRGKGGEEEQC